MPISKDESIITQVAAKIAADLVPDTGDINERIGNWAVAFDTVLQSIMEVHNPAQVVSSGPAPAPVPQAEPAFIPDPSAQVNAVFPNSQPVTNMTVQVKGTQHGPLPDWLIAQCSAAGVTQVWDNRDGLATNPKRPWFKAADGTKNNRGDDMAFWPPRGR